jgi:uncharacterized membrane protein YebE (DUF533 family)
MLAALIATPAAAQPAPNAGADSTPLILALVIAAIALWFGARMLINRARASKTQVATGGRFADYALHALVNAAKIDNKVIDDEKRAITTAMSEIWGQPFDPSAVERAFENATLSKDELVAYLQTNATAFTQDQRVLLLKALLAVFAADGHFDENEHAALIDYTAAVGFERRSAAERLRALVTSATSGRFT